MDNYKNDGFPLASYRKYHNFSMLIEISWLINISQMNDARDTRFSQLFCDWSNITFM